MDTPGRYARAISTNARRRLARTGERVAMNATRIRVPASTVIRDPNVTSTLTSARRRRAKTAPRVAI